MKYVMLLMFVSSLALANDCRQLMATEHSCWIGGSYKTDCDCPQPKSCTPKTIYKTKWKTKTIYKDKIVIKEKVIKKDPPKNNISLMGERAFTGLDGNHTPGRVYTETTPEVAVGLMYQRRFGNWRASIGAFTNGSAILGFGRDF